MEVCTSPWPLFILACETTTDADRIKILRVLDRMDNSRTIGNVFVLRSIIEAFWKQKDLQEDVRKPKHVDWRHLVNLDTASPWFI
jgi:hypothetical protein